MTSGNGFRLSTAQFKGKVLESLDNIKEDIREIKTDNSEQHKLFFDRIRKLELKPSFSINPVAWIKLFLGFR